MKFVFVALIFAAGCAASPITQAESDSAVHTLSYIDRAPPELEPLNANISSLASRDTYPSLSCPAGQTHDRSVCYNSQTIRSFCVANPRQDREQKTDTPCNSGEVCVQRNLSTGKSYATCIPITKLVSWRTGPNGQKEGCTSNLELHPPGWSSMASIVYDINHYPMQVDTLKYVGEPGDRYEGTFHDVAYASSDRFNFVEGSYMKGKNVYDCIP
ncbi:secreted in xylem 6-like protein [Lizonia empirigonia]|nr:secreted in xylem 6-like protein [Lizonia empirigonia]